MAFSLDDLEAIIAARASSDGETSYTRSLMDKGLNKATEKFGEEAVETIISALGEDKGALIAETSDLLFHLLVVLNMRGVAVSDVMGELDRRTSQSGHAEKAARPQP